MLTAFRPATDYSFISEANVPLSFSPAPADPQTHACGPSDPHPQSHMYPFSADRTVHVQIYCTRLIFLCCCYLRYGVWGSHHCLVSSACHTNWQSSWSAWSFLPTESAQSYESDFNCLRIWNCNLFPGKLNSKVYSKCELLVCALYSLGIYM